MGLYEGDSITHTRNNELKGLYSHSCRVDSDIRSIRNSSHRKELPYSMVKSTHSLIYPLSSVQGCIGLEHSQLYIGQDVGYNIDRSLVYHRANIETAIHTHTPTCNFEPLINLTYMKHPEEGYTST